jgi:hypothetical protein
MKAKNVKPIHCLCSGNITFEPTRTILFGDASTRPVCLVRFNLRDRESPNNFVRRSINDVQPHPNLNPFTLSLPILSPCHRATMSTKRICF